MNPFVALKVSHRLYLIYAIVIVFVLGMYGAVVLSIGGLERMSHEAFDQAAQVDGQAREMLAEFDRLLGLLHTTMPVFVLLLTLALFAIVRSITRPLHELGAVLGDLAKGGGSMPDALEVHDRHELGQVARALETFTAGIRGVVRRVHGHSAEAIDTVFHLEVESREALVRVEQSADRMNGMAAATEQMTMTTASIAQSCSNVAERSRQASQTAAQGAEVVRETVDTMQAIAARVRDSAEVVEGLGVRSQQIGTIVGTIKEIADQTNLLALNAAIEAARAGELGRGFAVVADEVRALANRTNRATQEIGEMIQSIQAETATAVDSMHQGLTEAEQGSDAAVRSGAALSDILDGARAVSSEIDQIAAAAEELAVTNSEVSRDIAEINALTQESLHQSRRAEETAGRLMGIFQELQGALGRFRCENDLDSIVHKAKIAHMLFVRRIKLHQMGQERLDAGALPDHRHCEFGLWYKGAGQTRFADNTAFQELDGHHQRVHELGKQIVQAHDAANQVQANALYEQMIGESLQLQGLLDRLAA
ncbi:methyl-accepting chemotaxis protein [Thiorhodococcus fuscus]|uniref:Methyl-accepting chemotaxis protein n=1 Tax=Thiorhodococcus fuscus TaxID=527200 RepID=A0ABW4Y4Y3_9GAMM